VAEEMDFSKAIEQVKEMLSSDEGESQIQNLLGMLTGSADTSQGDAASSPDPSGNNDGGLFSGIEDIDAILKIKNLLSSFGNQKNDSNIIFLQALKPYLSPLRQEKLESASKILSATKVLRAFKDSGLGGV
jgi:hypothetical protein